MDTAYASKSNETPATNLIIGQIEDLFGVTGDIAGNVINLCGGAPAEPSGKQVEPAPNGQLEDILKRLVSLKSQLHQINGNLRRAV